MTSTTSINTSVIALGFGVGSRENVRSGSISASIAFSKASVLIIVSFGIVIAVDGAVVDGSSSNSLGTALVVLPTMVVTTKSTQTSEAVESIIHSAESAIEHVSVIVSVSVVMRTNGG